MAEVLASFMEPIGIVLAPSFNNWPSFLKKIEQKRAQLFYLIWLADYPDPENYLQLFYGPSGTPGANRSNYRNAEFDRLYQRAVWMRGGRSRMLFISGWNGLYRKIARGCSCITPCRSRSASRGSETTNSMIFRWE